MKLVHAADLHLDSPLRGLSSYPGAPVARIRGAARRALENLVALCVNERAELLVIAGDLYDGDWRDYSTGLFFMSQMALLKDAGVEVAWIRGNHDAASQITRHLRPIGNVHELPFDRPQTLCFEKSGIAVHGQGFATRAVTENLSQSYPARVQGLINVGLLHTSVNGRPPHDPYAPCTLEGLRNKGYDYWALGHVHTREVLSTEPWVVFPGNLQGRHARELGAKGATLVSYDAGGIREVTHVPLDVVRYAQVDVDLGATQGFDHALDAVRVALARAAEAADGRTLAVRVVLSATTLAHSALRGSPERFASELQSCAVDLGGEELWIEKVLWQTLPSEELRALRLEHGAIGELAGALGALRADPAGLAALAPAELAQLLGKLPADAREGEGALRLDDPEFLAAQLDEVEALLFERLLAPKELP